jgi:hypothetical protein
MLLTIRHSLRWDHKTGDSQEGDSVSGVVLDQNIPSRGGEGGRVTPGVIVNSIEISTLIRGSAVQIIGQQLLVLGNIRCRVSNRDRSISSGSNVLLYVTSDGFNVGSGVGVGSVVNDLISREEGENVGVVGKGINGCKHALEVDGVVRFGRVGTVEGVLGGIGVEDEVDTSSGESSHARVMVCGVVYGVDTDSVDSKFGEVSNISLARCCVGNRIGFYTSSSTRLVCNTSDVETLSSLEESWNQLAYGRIVERIEIGYSTIALNSNGCEGCGGGSRGQNGGCCSDCCCKDCGQSAVDCRGFHFREQSGVKGDKGLACCGLNWDLTVSRA